MKKKLVLLLLMSIMLSSVTGAATVLEDFEGDLSAWNIDQGEADVSIAADPTDPNNRALLIPNATVTMGLPWAVGPDERQTLGFRMLYTGEPADVNNNAVVGVSDGDGRNWGNYFAIVRMYKKGLDYRDGGAYVTGLDTVDPMDWYDIVLDLDMATLSYDLYVNGLLVVEAAGFRSQSINGVFEVLIKSTDALNMEAVYVDDFMAGVPVPEGQVLEDFEGDLSAWDITQGADVVSIAEDPTDPNNHALLIPSAVTTLTLPWTVDPNGRQTLGFRMLYTGEPENVANNAVVGVSDGNGANWGNYFAIVRMYQQGLDYRDGGAYVTGLDTVDSLVWYDIVMDLDVASLSYDLYVSDVLIIEGAAFRSQSADGVAEILVKSTDALLFDGVYIDDFVAGVKVPEVLIEEEL